jgi:hypothetical protein
LAGYFCHRPLSLPPSLLLLFCFLLRVVRVAREGWERLGVMGVVAVAAGGRWPAVA